MFDGDKKYSLYKLMKTNLSGIYVKYHFEPTLTHKGPFLLFSLYQKAQLYCQPLVIKREIIQIYT